MDLTNKRFGRLIALYKIQSSKSSNSIKWHCKCDCGNEKDVVASSLNNGDTKSCGCLKKETTSKIFKKYNTYNLSSKFGIGYTSNTNKEFYFDLEDYDKIKNYCWSEDANKYLYTKICTDKITTLYFHRVIMNVISEEIDVDHIAHNKFDNRKENLRIGSHQRNTINVSKRKDNTSGVVGVSYRKDRNKWKAEINFENKYIYLGNYDKFEDAVKARKEAEEKYFGEWSYDNSMKNDKGE